MRSERGVALRFLVLLLVLTATAVCRAGSVRPALAAPLDSTGRGTSG